MKYYLNYRYNEEEPYFESRLTVGKVDKNYHYHTSLDSDIDPQESDVYYASTFTDDGALLLSVSHDPEDAMKLMKGLTALGLNCEVGMLLRESSTEFPLCTMNDPEPKVFLNKEALLSCYEGYTYSSDADTNTYYLESPNGKVVFLFRVETEVPLVNGEVFGVWFTRLGSQGYMEYGKVFSREGAEDYAEATQERWLCEGQKDFFFWVVPWRVVGKE